MAFCRDKLNRLPVIYEDQIDANGAVENDVIKTMGGLSRYLKIGEKPVRVCLTG